MRRITALNHLTRIILGGGLAIMGLTFAHASLPVPFAMVGCIQDGRFVTESGLRTARLKSAALTALEGRTIRIEGLLGPSNFRASEVFEVAATCKEALYASYFLCDPCQTILSHPPSRMIPPREPGRRLDMPQPALDELDDLNSKFVPN